MFNYQGILELDAHMKSKNPRRDYLNIFNSSKNGIEIIYKENDIRI